ncbi:MAG: hypothetical protein K8T91_09150 [Planctomycetes bacterium]|nr:hypothetical protein [Planctomycetota bacterium]
MPEGQVVTVIVRPQSQVEPTGNGLEQSFGGWADDPDELDEFLEWNRLQRKKSRSGIEP